MAASVPQPKASSEVLLAILISKRKHQSTEKVYRLPNHIQPMAQHIIQKSQF